jgi:hypothetical protein
MEDRYNSEKRFKHKLNMLEPGTKMLKWIGILASAGILLYILRLRMAAFFVWTLSGMIFVVLIVLLVIEGHQDKVLNDIAIKENRENGVL